MIIWLTKQILDFNIFMGFFMFYGRQKTILLAHTYEKWFFSGFMDLKNDVNVGKLFKALI